MLSVAYPEICPRGVDDSQNLRRGVVTIFFLTSLAGVGGRPQGHPWIRYWLHLKLVFISEINRNSQLLSHNLEL